MKSFHDRVHDVGTKCLDFLAWYDEVEELWKLFLIPMCILAYTIFILTDAIDFVMCRIED